MLWRFHHLRTKLLISMLAVVFLLTAAVLLLVQARMRSHVREDLVSTLRAESAVYNEIEKARREQAEQNALMIADQPSLKALMSTNDRLTVEDGSASMLRSSHADLLILENVSGDLLAFHSTSDDVPVSTLKHLMQGSRGEEDWWFAGGHLYDVSLVPIVAGINANQRPLGRMALGRQVSSKSTLDAAFGKAAFVFDRHGAVLLSSLPPGVWGDFELSLKQRQAKADLIQEVNIGSERYLTHFVELPGDHPVRLYSLQSYDQATVFLGSLNRLLLILGALAVVAGAFVAFFVSRQITRPLERLAQGTRQLEQGDFEFQIPVHRRDEV